MTSTDMTWSIALGALHTEAMYRRIVLRSPVYSDQSWRSTEAPPRSR